MNCPHCNQEVIGTIDAKYNRPILLEEAPRQYKLESTGEPFGEYLGQFNLKDGKAQYWGRAGAPYRKHKCKAQEAAFDSLIARKFSPNPSVRANYETDEVPDEHAWL